MIAHRGWILIAWAALAACGGGATAPRTAAPAPPGQPGAAPSCGAAIERLFAVAAVDEPPEIRDVAAKAFVRRCEADRWSAEIQRCMLAIARPEDGDACEAMLTPAQTRELRDELARELDAAGVKPEMESGRPKAKSKSRAAPAAAPPVGGAADPCEGGE